MHPKAFSLSTSSTKKHTAPQPKRWPRRIGLSLLVILGIVLIVLRFKILPDFDAKSNRSLNPGLSEVPQAIQNLHDSAFVADLHADPLLWKRNLRKHLKHGHVDLPRLKQGGVDLQVFGVVTRVPKGTNYRANADTDRLSLLFLASWRFPTTWWSAKARAVAQARELRGLSRGSDLSLVLNRGDLEQEGLKGLLALEGMHALEGKASALDTLHRAGYRMMGLAHFADNAVAGSAHGLQKHGLTELGKSLIPRMESLGITIDLAHASPTAFQDTLQLAAHPVVVSHGGVQGTCPGPRNLSDQQLRRLAANGGVVGIGFWRGAICEVTVDAIVRAIRHAVAVAGVDHVGLGSDFDGNTTTPIDAAGLPLLTHSLRASDFSETDVKKIMGGNVHRVLSANLPE